MNGFLSQTKTTTASTATLSLRMSSPSEEGAEEKEPEPFRLPHRSRRTQHKDTVIIGSGLAGLSAALYLSQMDPDRHITIVDRQAADNIEAKKKTTVSSFAAAGMLAPQSERLPKGPLLDLCLSSRKMYPEFCDLVESLAKESGDEGAKYLYQPTQTEGNAQTTKQLDPWTVGYMASGGFLAPAFAGDTVATWAPPDDGGSAIWLDEIQVRELEPSLHPDVVGGWWFSEDASVDARRLTCSLHAACVTAGVQFSCGTEFEVTSLDLNDGKCHGLWLQNGHYLKTKSVLVANGAWMRNLLPVPIEPHKGQSLSLRMPKDRPPILRRVLFAQDSYIVPKADGTIVIGATVEAGSFDGNVTPAGLLHVLTHALQLVPGLQNLPIVETWAGLRPTTPDKGPIIGKSPWDNLFLAGGYWRNGVLLAPKTAQLLACLMTDKDMTAKDTELLEAFAWDRFTVKGGGAALAANARYAASMHPIHSRVSGAGVAASVGTELGSYSTASSAKQERQKDRSAMFGGDGSDDAFERAAALGRQDATTFIMGDKVSDTKPKASKKAATTPDIPTEAKDESYSEKTYDGYQDIQDANSSDNRNDELAAMRKARMANRLDQTAIDESKIGAMKMPEDIVEGNNDDEEINGKNATAVVSSSADVASAYKTIMDNKSKKKVTLPESGDDEAQADPGFRIFHVDPKSGEKREVPPYTTPGQFLQSISKESDTPEAPVNGKTQPVNGVSKEEKVDHNGGNGDHNGKAESEEYSEKTYDGYQAIIDANSGTGRQDQLDAMRKARQQNRIGHESVDESKLD